MATHDQHPGEYSPGEDSGSSGSSQHSHLFTVRVWQETADPAGTEWRGRLQHHPGGQVCYFRDWDGLVNDMLLMLSGDDRTTFTPTSARIESQPERRGLNIDNDREER